MKNASCLIIVMFSFLTSTSQNTGIGTTTPVQTLDVNGAIKVGTSTNNQPGSIRYNAGTFEAGDGTTWKSLGLPPKAIILSQTVDTASIKAAGFSVLRQMDNWDTVLVPVSTNYAGTWTAGFPLSSTAVTPGDPTTNECVIYNNHFIFFGTDSYLYDYDITAQKWAKLPNISPLGTNRQGCGVTLVGNEVYITGGWKFVAGFVIYNTAAKYNLATNVWTSIANIPVTNCYHPSVTIGTDIYILDGASTFTTNFDFARKMYKYNTLTNTWSADLSVPATPDYIYQGQAIVWNNKIIYQGGYLRVYSYDPVTHVNTNLTPGTPPFVGVNYYGLLSLAGNKLYMLGNIDDTTNINPVPSTYMNEFFEVDLTNGNTVQLSVCLLPGGTPSCYQYDPVTNKFYAASFFNKSYIFERPGSQQCDVILRRKGYWYYMKKN